MRPAPGSEPGPARDRDAAGRARNARPRDGLGRPLGRGASGEPTMPDGVALSPQDALEAAQRLLDEGRPFHAHEVLEASWKTAPPAERDLWQGLAQLAVGLTHALRGNAGGAVTLLRRGAARVGQYQAGRHGTGQHDSGQHGVDVHGVDVHGVDVHGVDVHGVDVHGVDVHGVDVAGVAAAATGLADRIDEHGLSGLTPGDLRLELRRS